jgi:glycosyltransferase involved in cell wall biosynthesis
MNRLRVALVMIARNEAPRIVRALASARSHVDELVVLDTGSTDATISLARAAGARVGRFAWIDDFSAARNAALDLADADWNVIVDADEWLESGSEVLLALRHTPPDFVGALRVDSRFDDAQGVGTAPSWLPRVLPRGVRYEGRIHEQPVHAMRVRRLEAVLGHDGYRHQALQAKAGRNRALLESALRQAPADAYLHYQLGKDHDAYERYAEAAACFARSRACELAALGPEAAPSAAGPAWHHDRLVRELHALKQCVRHAEAVLLAQPEMERWADSPDFFFALGDLFLDWAAREPARADELLPMIESAWKRCLEIGERPDLEGAVAGRGSWLAARNLVVFYEGTGRSAEAARLREAATARH